MSAFYVDIIYVYYIISDVYTLLHLPIFLPNVISRQTIFCYLQLLI